MKLVVPYSVISLGYRNLQDQPFKAVHILLKKLEMQVPALVDLEPCEAPPATVQLDLVEAEWLAFARATEDAPYREVFPVQLFVRQLFLDHVWELPEVKDHTEVPNPSVPNDGVGYALSAGKQAAPELFSASGFEAGPSGDIAASLLGPEHELDDLPGGDDELEFDDTDLDPPLDETVNDEDGDGEDAEDEGDASVSMSLRPN